jgi:hypothetical protein
MQHAPDDFQNRLEAHLQGITDPVDAVTEAIATALESLPKDEHLDLPIVPGQPNPHTELVTSDIALDFVQWFDSFTGNTQRPSLKSQPVWLGAFKACLLGLIRG